MKKGEWSRSGLGSLAGLEIEIMPIVWRKGKVTIKAVFEEMYEKHSLTYTTIMSVMNRLAKKGILNQDRSTIPFMYSAAISREEMASLILDEIVNKILEGSPGLLTTYCKERQIEDQNFNQVPEQV